MSCIVPLHHSSMLRVQVCTCRTKQFGPTWSNPPCISSRLIKIANTVLVVHHHESRMIEEAELKERVNRLFHLFEKGKWDESKSLFAPDAVLRQMFSGGGSQSVDEFITNAKDGALGKLGLPKYTNRKVTIMNEGEMFIEEHTTTLKVHGNPVQLQVCLVGSFVRESGLIGKLDEYLDPSPLAKAMMSSPKQEQEGLNKKSVIVSSCLCVVITGASSGIGEEIAYRYAAQGCKLCLAGRREAELDRVAGKCLTLSPDCEALVCVTDVSVKQQCEDLISRVVGKFGRVNRLYLNAGVSQSCTVEESHPDLVDQIMAVNFFGAAWTAKAAVPHLKAAARSGDGAKVAVVSSALGRLVAPTQAVYCASKWALHGYFGSLRLELEPVGVAVSIICPGPVRTPIQDKLYGPGNSRVAFQVDEKGAANMMTASTAADLCFEACENDTRELVFGNELNKLVALRSKAPEQVDAILAGLYNGLAEKSTPSPKSSL